MRTRIRRALLSGRAGAAAPYQCTMETTYKGIGRKRTLRYHSGRAHATVAGQTPSLRWPYGEHLRQAYTR